MRFRSVFSELKPRNGNFMLMFAQVPEENITIISPFFMLYLSSGWWELKYDRPIYEGLPTLWFLNLIFSPHIIDSKPKISLNLPILGFILLKTDLKRTFYVIL